MDAAEEYRYQPFPNLSSIRQPDTASRFYDSIDINLSNDDSVNTERLKLLVRVAFARIIMLYLDSRDFRFAEISVLDNKNDSNEPVSMGIEDLVPLRIILGGISDTLDDSTTDKRKPSWEDVGAQFTYALEHPDSISLDIGLEDSPTHDRSRFPFPVIFSWEWDLSSNSPRGQPLHNHRLSYILNAPTIVIGLSFPGPPPAGRPNSVPEKCSLNATANASLMSPSMLHMLLQQTYLILQAILKDPSAPFTSPLRGPQLKSSPVSPVFSQYESPIFQSRVDNEFVPLRWLSDTARKFPDRVAHEFYTAETLSSVESSERGKGVQPLAPSSFLTYGRLNTLSNRLARCLMKDYRVKKGDMIGVCLERDEDFYVIVAAIWRCGAVYVSVRTSSISCSLLFPNHGLSTLALDRSFVAARTQTVHSRRQCFRLYISIERGTATLEFRQPRVWRSTSGSRIRKGSRGLERYSGFYSLIYIG